MRLILSMVVIVLLLSASFGCVENTDKTPNGDNNVHNEENPIEDNPLDAEYLIENNCASCHNLNRVYVIKSKDQWPIIIDRMIGKSPGLLNEEEYSIVVEYLQENYSQ